MLSAADKKYLANLLSCGLIGQTAIDLINEKENNMRNQPKRENILFLAPNLNYAYSVVKNLCHFLYRNNIDYVSSPDPNRPHITTDVADIDFVCCDPVEWRGAHFTHRDAVFGKYELIAKAKKLCGCEYLIKTPNVCLDNYLISLVRKTTECDNPEQPTAYIPAIKKVHFNPPMTVVIWEDGTKTIVKCQDGDAYSKETGLALCISKKAFGNKGNFNDIFKKWIPEEEETETVTGVFYDTGRSAVTSRITNFRDEIVDDIADLIFKALTKNRKD